MMRLYLIRHGEAFEPSAERWPDDRSRPLTTAGTRSFRKAASGIARLAGQVDCVLTSPYLRAVQTAEILEDVAGWPHAIEAAELEPDGTAVQALAAARSRDVAQLAIVGHEPNLREILSLSLTGETRRLECKLSKGGAACMEFPSVLRAGSARLHWLIKPKALRALAKR